MKAAIALAALCLVSTSVGAARQRAGSTAYERLVSILEPGPGAPRPPTISQLLPALGDELRANFTLVYDSRSPHRGEIDPRFPRVVLFTGDGKLLLAFTGNPTGPAYDQLEVIHFDDRTSSFHTSRFILDAAVRRNPGLAAAAADNGRLDDASCTRCHGRDVRPIFDSYPLWPGFYGSLADRMSADARETRDFNRFLAANAGTGVYGQLLFPGGSSTAPYDDGQHGLAPADALRLHPNERLGDALTPLNWRRIVRRLAAGGDHYRRLQYPLLAGMLGCAELPISPGFEATIRGALEAENARRFERARLDATGENGRFRMSELVRNIPRFVAEVAYVARALGVSRADWSMSFEPDSLAFFDGVLNVPVFYVKQDLVTAMLGRLAAQDREFSPYFRPSFAFADAGYPLGLKLPMAELYGNPALCALLAERTISTGAPALPPY